MILFLHSKKSYSFYFLLHFLSLFSWLVSLLRSLAFTSMLFFLLYLLDTKHFKKSIIRTVTASQLNAFASPPPASTHSFHYVIPAFSRLLPRTFKSNNHENALSIKENHSKSCILDFSKQQTFTSSSPCFALFSSFIFASWPKLNLSSNNQRNKKMLFSFNSKHCAKNYFPFFEITSSSPFRFSSTKNYMISNAIIPPLQNEKQILSSEQENELRIWSKEEFDKNMNTILSQMRILAQEGSINATSVNHLAGFVKNYGEEVRKYKTLDATKFLSLFLETLRLLKENVNFEFSLRHEAIRKPFDFYAWGNNFWKPLIDLEHSKFVGVERVNQISQWLKNEENVVFFSNHQTEPDAQVIRLALEYLKYPELGEKIIMVAGHKVRKDPLSIPFSMGVNMLCVHSKKYIETPPEFKEQKQQENVIAMQNLQSILSTGGKIIWVAPSGGRDRPDESNEFVVAPFNVKTLQMFKITAKRVSNSKKTHFIPLALYTAPICPPPKTVINHLGETRTCAFSRIGMGIGDEIDSTLFTEEFAKQAEMQTKVMYNMIK